MTPGIPRVAAVSRSNGASKVRYGDMQIEPLFKPVCILTMGCSQNDLNLRDKVVGLMSLPAAAQTYGRTMFVGIKYR